MDLTEGGEGKVSGPLTGWFYLVNACKNIGEEASAARPNPIPPALPTKQALVILASYSLIGVLCSRLSGLHSSYGRFCNRTGTYWWGIAGCRDACWLVSEGRLTRLTPDDSGISLTSIGSPPRNWKDPHDIGGIVHSKLLLFQKYQRIW